MVGNPYPQPLKEGYQHNSLVKGVADGYTHSLHKPGVKEEIERYYTILEDEDFRDCTLDFAQFAFKCQGDPMYIRTDECESLARNWRGVPQIIADFDDE